MAYLLNLQLVHPTVPALRLWCRPFLITICFYRGTFTIMIVTSTSTSQAPSYPVLGVRLYAAAHPKWVLGCYAQLNPSSLLTSAGWRPELIMECKQQLLHTRILNAGMSSSLECHLISFSSLQPQEGLTILVYSKAFDFGAEIELLIILHARLTTSFNFYYLPLYHCGLCISSGR